MDSNIEFLQCLCGTQIGSFEQFRNLIKSKTKFLSFLDKGRQREFNFQQHFNSATWKVFPSRQTSKLLFAICYLRPLQQEKDITVLLTSWTTKVKFYNKSINIYHGMVCLAVKFMQSKSKQLSGNAIKFAYYKSRISPSSSVLKKLFTYKTVLYITQL